MKTHHLVVCLFVCIATLLTVSASASAQTTEWTFCAAEGEVCTFSGRQEVRYGANGLYFYRTLTNSTECTDKVFFGDPAPGAAKSCSLQTTVTSPPPSPPPTGDWTFCAAEGGTCAFTGTQQVRYGANGAYFYQTLTGGTACTNTVFGDPAPGVAKLCEVAGATSITEWTFCAVEGGSCAFSGTQQVRYGANGSYFYQTLTGGTACTNSVFGDPAPGVLKRCDVSGTPSASVPPPPPPSTYGPSAAISCPSGAYDLWPGSNIPYLISFQPAGTTYCVRAGVHYLTSAITPKRGDTLVGEYGAILDGSGWSTSDGTQAAFRAHNQDIDYVTIRNLVIRNMPQRGIHAYFLHSDHWTIEYNEITNSKETGLVFPGDSIIRNNYIHHNTFAGYLGLYADNTILEANEIAYNGGQQKVGETTNVTFRNNFVHHNAGTGIWYDSNNTGALVEGNRVEDNGLIGIFFEASSDNTIRNNTIRRNEVGVMLSISKNMQITGNTLDSNFRGITYFLNCQSMALSASYDLANNAASDNTIIVGTRSGAWASLLSYASCTSTQVAAYLNGWKNLTFSRNTYRVPSPTTGQYWLWWDALKYWNGWQSVGQDLNGTLSQ